MAAVTRILAQIDSGDPSATEQLLPLVYDELRKLAAAKLAHEKPGQTLQATALVHEAYLRLVGDQESGANDREPVKWNSRGHFFAAAAEAMRRILVEQGSPAAKCSPIRILRRCWLPPPPIGSCLARTYRPSAPLTCALPTWMALPSV